MDQSLDVPVPQMIEQWEEVPKMVSQNRIQRRTAEQIVEVPVPKVVEEHVEIAKVSSQNRVQPLRGAECPSGHISERGVEQFVDVPGGQTVEVSHSRIETVEAVAVRNGERRPHREVAVLLCKPVQDLHHWCHHLAVEFSRNQTPNITEVACFAAQLTLSSFALSNKKALDTHRAHDQSLLVPTQPKTF